jgi:hypothetical protein
MAFRIPHLAIFADITRQSVIQDTGKTYLNYWVRKGFYYYGSALKPKKYLEGYGVTLRVTKIMKVKIQNINIKLTLLLLSV